MDRGRAERVLAELRRRREAEAKRDANRAFAAKLREFYYPKQGAFFTARSKRRATKKTRRSGATAGGCRELVARAVERAGFTAVYATTTLQEARIRAWKSSTGSGLVDIIEQYGERLDDAGTVARYRCGAVEVSIRNGDLELIFDNGSKIELFGANHENATTKLKGAPRNVYWIDEAQDFKWLERFYKATINANMADFGGEVWLTGTPCEDLVGFFYEVTRDEIELRRSGWEVFQFAATDNPFFGRVMWEGGQWWVLDNLYTSPDLNEEEKKAHKHGPFATEELAEEAAIKVRWEQTAGEQIRENHWAEDDPDLLRDWYARWVKTDARYVYDAHKVPEHELVYAPQRFREDGFPDIQRALQDLPGWAANREYLLGLGADLGTTRAFSWVVVAWSMLDPVLYEVASWKKAGLDYDEMADVLRAVQAQARIGLWVADAGGGGKPAVANWSKKWVERYKLPIIEATKPNKIIAIRQLNTDIRKLHYRVREGSPLLEEWKSHRWAPLKSQEGKLVEDPASFRDCCDASLYIHRESYHHRWHEPEKKLVTGTPEWIIREEAELLDVATDYAGR